MTRLLLLLSLLPTTMISMGMDKDLDFYSGAEEQERKEKIDHDSICAAQLPSGLPATKIITLSGKTRLIANPVVDDALHDRLYEFIRKDDVKGLESMLKNGANPNCHHTRCAPVFAYHVGLLTPNIPAKLAMVDLFMHYGAGVNCDAVDNIADVHLAEARRSGLHSLLAEVIARPTRYQYELAKKLLNGAAQKNSPYFSPSDEKVIDRFSCIFPTIFNDEIFKPIVRLLIYYRLPTPRAWITDDLRSKRGAEKRRIYGEQWQKHCEEFRALHNFMPGTHCAEWMTVDMARQFCYGDHETQIGAIICGLPKPIQTKVFEYVFGRLATATPNTNEELTALEENFEAL